MSSFLCGTPSMGVLLRVQVPPRVGHNERSEAQLREGVAIQNTLANAG